MHIWNVGEYQKLLLVLGQSVRSLSKMGLRMLQIPKSMRLSESESGDSAHDELMCLLAHIKQIIPKGSLPEKEVPSCSRHPCSSACLGWSSSCPSAYLPCSCSCLPCSSALTGASKVSLAGFSGAIYDFGIHLVSCPWFCIFAEACRLTPIRT